MATIFMTGATGSIGNHILGMLAKHHTIYALAYTKRGDDYPNVKWVNGDIRRPETLDKTLAECDVLLHMAADVSNSSDSLHRVNVQAARDLVLHARAKGCKKIIVFSSASVTQKYLTPYAQSKHAMEKELAHLNVPLILVRPTLVYAKGSNYLRGMERYLHLPLPFVPLFNGGKANLRPIHAHDVGNAILAILKKPFPTTFTRYDLAAEEDFTYAQIVKLIAERRGITKPFVGVPHAFLGELYPLVRATGLGISKRFIQFAALGEGYHVDPRPFVEKYGVHFTPPEKGIRDALK